MRKIAEEIEYSATMIYEYFENKEALLVELTRLGFLRLLKDMKNASKRLTDPKKKLVGMWLAYWKFAFAEKEFYQLMFGIGTSCQSFPIHNWGSVRISAIVSPVINAVIPNFTGDGFVTECKYYAYWSAVHGLISLNFLNKGNSDDVNMQVLLDTINGITVAETNRL
jgi:AcrR family transcriptional regulator